MVTQTDTPELELDSDRGVELSPAIQAMREVRFRIPADVINQGLEKAPDAEREALKWFAGHCRARNLGRDEISRLLKKPDGDGYYSYDSVYQTLTGRRQAAGNSVEDFVQAVQAFRKITEAREQQTQSGFIPTRLTKRIWEACRKALLRQKIIFIFGESQIGKTEALQEYQRQHNHGETIYVRMPTRGALGLFLQALAVALDIPPQQKTGQLMERIMASIDSRMLLIVDECHQSVQGGASYRGAASLDFAREIYDRKKCGLVLCGTNVFRDEIAKGGHAKMLRQLWLRRLAPIYLPDRPSAEDLDTFAIAFGLPPAPDEAIRVSLRLIDSRGEEVTKSHTDNPRALQDSVIAADGLGLWIAMLQEASDLAREAKRPISWGAVLKAHAEFKAMETKG